MIARNLERGRRVDVVLFARMCASSGDGSRLSRYRRVA